MSLGRSTTTDGAATLLADPRYELMPFDSFAEQMDHLPDDAVITVTASPTQGLEATIDWSERAAGEGFELVPHVAARYVRDRDHLDEIAGRLVDAGVTDVFVPGGDREEPVGEFESALELLVALEELGYEFDDVGITGYPEGHEFLPEETLAAAMADKRPHATYLTTQLCYDPEAIVEWIERVRTERGIDLPVEVGIPGVMNYARLVGISRKVGVGDSIRFLKKTSGLLGFVRQFVGSRGKYKPDELVDGLAPYADDPDYGIRGLHVYTFNQVPDTEAWRRGRLES
jgi:methylenetetrahydrofolate reductase (NADPH)